MTLTPQAVSLQEYVAAQTEEWKAREAQLCQQLQQSARALQGGTPATDQAAHADGCAKSEEHDQQRSTPAQAAGVGVPGAWHDHVGGMHMQPCWHGHAQGMVPAPCHAHILQPAAALHVSGPHFIHQHLAVPQEPQQRQAEPQQQQAYMDAAASTAPDESFTAHQVAAENSSCVGNTGKQARLQALRATTGRRSARSGLEDKLREQLTKRNQTIKALKEALEELSA